jgi:hypothetical protein
MTIFALIDVVLIVWGASMLITNFIKPNWYWNSPRMQMRRSTMGDEKVSTIYYGIAVIMLAVGLLGRLGFLG